MVKTELNLKTKLFVILNSTWEDSVGSGLGTSRDPQAAPGRRNQGKGCPGYVAKPAEKTMYGPGFVPEAPSC